MRHRTLVDRWGVPCTSSLDELLAMLPVECALVCTPDHRHLPDAMDCLRHGLHVLVEKPMCPAFDEARALVDAFRDRGRILASGMVERHNPAWRTFVERVPTLGTLHRLEILRSGRIPSHRSSGILRDLAIHDLDLLWGWLGERELSHEFQDGPRAVELRSSQLPELRLVARWDDAPTCRTWVLEGSRGTLVLDLQERTVSFSEPLGSPERLPVPASDPLEMEHRQFSAAIRGEESPSSLDIPRHLGILALCDRLDPGSVR